MRTIIERNSRGNVVVVDVLTKLSEERIVFIDSDIDEEMTSDIIGQLLYLDSVSSEPIQVYINTYGGSVNDGLAIYDTIKMLKSPVITIGIGKVCSMGLIILLAAEDRRSLPNTSFMGHKILGGASGSVKDVEINYKEMERLNAILFDIIRNTTKINPDEEYIFEKWYSAKEALNSGIITEII